MRVEGTVHATLVFGLVALNPANRTPKCREPSVHLSPVAQADALKRQATSLQAALVSRARHPRCAPAFGSLTPALSDPPG